MMLLLRLRAWASICRQQGPIVLMRVLQRSIEEAVASRGLPFALQAARGWHLACVVVGLAIGAAAPWPALDDQGRPQALKFLTFIVVAGIGGAVAVRSLALLVRTFSLEMMASGARIPLRPTLLRGLGLLAVAAVAVGTPWPLSGWVSAATAGVLWLLWPLVGSLDAVFRSVTFTRYRSPMRALLVQHKRGLDPQTRRRMAVHEAGHAVFFGLARSYPEDLFAYLEEDLPTPDEIAQAGGVIVGGAIHAFNDLGRLWVAPNVGRAELRAALGMLCGGTAAEQVVYGGASLSHLLDAGEFERRAKVYLMLFPDEQLPFFCKPEGVGEAAANARSIAELRRRMEAQAIDFLGANREVLEALAEQLDRHGELNVEQLAVHLERVRPSDCFAQFEWPEGLPVYSPAPRPPAGAISSVPS